MTDTVVSVFGTTLINDDSPLSEIFKDKVKAYVAMEKKFGQPIVTFKYDFPKSKIKIHNRIFDDRKSCFKRGVFFEETDFLFGNKIEITDDKIVVSGKDPDGKIFQVATDKKLLELLCKEGFTDDNHIIWYKI